MLPTANRNSQTTPYAWYVAGLLALAQIVAVMDRYVLSVVLESVKHDLALTIPNSACCRDRVSSCYSRLRASLSAGSRTS